jgi:hypothetical protein
MAKWIFALAALGTLAACDPETKREFCRDHYRRGLHEGQHITCQWIRDFNSDVYERLRNEQPRGYLSGICP